MRAFIGHRLPLGFYGGVSVPFHPSRMFLSHGSGDGSPAGKFIAWLVGTVIGVILACIILTR
jgi:hypothetical protein